MKHALLESTPARQGALARLVLIFPCTLGSLKEDSVTEQVQTAPHRDSGYQAGEGE